jgi:hypothetical protein
LRHRRRSRLKNRNWVKISLNLAMGFEAPSSELKDLVTGRESIIFRDCLF